MADRLDAPSAAIDDVTAAFTGDLLATAHAFLCACELMPIR